MENNMKKNLKIELIGMTILTLIFVIVIIIVAVAMNQPQNVSQQERNEWLHLHNKYRSAHGSNPLIWSDVLENEAKHYAKHLSANCKLEHSNTTNGENLAMQRSSSPLKLMDHVNWASSVWYDEVQNYDFSNPGYHQNGVVGHFTQMIWKDSKEIGCSVQECDNGFVSVCQYRPAGNVMGKFAEKRYWDLFTANKMAKSYVDLYKSLLQK